MNGVPVGWTVRRVVCALSSRHKDGVAEASDGALANPVFESGAHAPGQIEALPQIRACEGLAAKWGVR